MAEGSEHRRGDLEPIRYGWRKSTVSGTKEDSNCLELAATPAAMLIRDSKDRDGPVLTFTHGAWKAFRVRMDRADPFRFGQ